MILGNLTRDPEMRYTPQGHAVTSFAVATNRQWNTEDGSTKEATEFHNIVAWNKLAEICSQLLKKGSKVYIEGRLQTRNWEDDKGIKHYKTEIIADDMIVLSSRSYAEGASAGSVEKKTPAEPVAPVAEEKRSGEAQEVVDADEMPF